MRKVAANSECELGASDACEGYYHGRSRVFGKRGSALINGVVKSENLPGQVERFIA